MDRVDYQAIIVQDLINLEKSNELDLSPWYQRRSVWAPPQKAYLINTLFEQKPVPAIYVRHSLDSEKGKSIREVVDGQQRTRTILGYVNEEFSALHPELGKRVRFSQLSKEQQQKFLLTSIPVGYLLGATDADVIEIFGRINSVSKSLNAQEKRNAAYSGEMKQLCLKQASSRTSFWRNYSIFSANDIARMSEVQFISDLAFNLLNGLSDYSAKNLDDLYKEYDECFEQFDEINLRLDRVFDFLASMDPPKLKDTIFKRQPIFFSLFIVLDSIEIEKMSIKKFEEALVEMDNRYNSAENKSEKDLAFYNASIASTQRISQRKVRDEYIRSFLR